MRLAILGHFPFDAPARGGIQSVIASLRDEFGRDESIDLHLIQHRQGVPNGTYERAGCTLHNFAAQPSRWLPNMMRTRGLVAPLLRDLASDAISTHQFEYALPALDTGCSTVHTIHGFPGKELRTRRDWFTRAASLWELYLERQTLRRVQHIIAISNHVIERYRNQTKAQFHRVNNPVATLFFEPSPAPEPNRLVFVGNLTPRKGLEVAIAAVNQLRSSFPNLVFEIIGAPADAAYAEALRRQAAPLGDAVSFAGSPPQAEIRLALARAQALVLTSFDEHAPVIVAETMAAGRAVVATTVGALPDMVEPGVTGYLAQPGNPEAVAQHLARLLADPHHAADLGAEAARRARQLYHPAAVARGYLLAIAAAGRAGRAGGG